jgi:hypothetical protein
MGDRGPWAQLASGSIWYPASPSSDEVFTDDVAAAISKICRFGGHIRPELPPYSVAQHSVLVARLLRERGEPAQVQLQGLLHDAHEAYPPGDVLAPVKRALGRAVSGMERLAADAVRDRFGVPRDLHASVRNADLVLLATERRDLMAPSAIDWGSLPFPMNETIEPWSWKAARAIWLDLLTELRQEVRRG